MNQPFSTPCSTPSSIEPVPHGGDLGEQFLGLSLHLVGEGLDEVGAAERIGDRRQPRLVGEHLLRAQRQGRGLLRRQRQDLVEGVRMQ